MERRYELELGFGLVRVGELELEPEDGGLE